MAVRKNALLERRAQNRKAEAEAQKNAETTDSIVDTIVNLELSKNEEPEKIDDTEIKEPETKETSSKKINSKEPNKKNQRSKSYKKNNDAEASSEKKQTTINISTQNNSFIGFLAAKEDCTKAEVLKNILDEDLKLNGDKELSFEDFQNTSKRTNKTDETIVINIVLPIYLINYLKRRSKMVGKSVSSYIDSLLTDKLNKTIK